MTKVNNEAKLKQSSNRTLIQFSGLAWNLKTTIVDDICKCSPRFVRLKQTNKSHQDKEKTPSPWDLKHYFIKANEEILKGSSDVITDRAIIDYDIYDLMMNPMYAHNLFELRSSNAFYLNAVDRYQRNMNFYENFDRVITVSLQTSNRKFIRSIFNKQPESSTSYLFDNPDKYSYYSNFFNELSDHLHNKLVIDVNKRHGIKFRRLFYKFTETDTPEEFISRVRFGVINEINNIGIHV